MRPYLAAGLAGLLLSACSSPTLRFEDPSALGFDAVPVTPIADVATTIAVHGAPDFLEVASVGSAWVMNPATASVQLITDDGVQDEVTGVNPIGAMCRAFGSLWTASKKRGQPGELVRIDPRTRRIEARMPVGMLSYESTLAAVGGKLWILTHRRGDLVAIDPDTNTIAGTMKVARNSYGLAAGFGSLWVTSLGPVVEHEEPEEGWTPGLLQRIDPDTFEVTARIELGPRPLFLACGEGLVWVVNQGDGTVSAVDPDTDAVARRIPLGIAGAGGDIAVGEGRVWVRASEVLLTVVDAWSGGVVARYGPQAGSGGVRIGEGSVWLSAHDTEQAWRLPVSALD